MSDYVETAELCEISIEPHWPGVFALAVTLVNRSMSTDDGRDLVVELLKYGQRLSEAQPLKTD